MDNNNEKWEKLISMPDTYSENPELVDKAIQEIQSRQQVPKEKTWWQQHWKKVVACTAACALVVGIGIPVYKNLTPASVSKTDSSTSASTPPVIYYDSSDLEAQNITDIHAFIAEHNLGIGFFQLEDMVVPMLQSQAGIIKDTGKVGFLHQKVVYMDGQGFDQIELNVILEKNLILDFQEQYSNLNAETEIGTIKVEYKEGIEPSTQFRQIYAKFAYENAEYYLDIVTESEPIACIQTYVEILTA